MILLQGRVAEATSLARRHSHAPHFSRSLEWLLFTSLEFNADDAPSPANTPPPGALEPNQHSPERPRRGATAGSLLLAAAALIRNFPQVYLPVFSLPYRMRTENLQLQQRCLRRDMQWLPMTWASSLVVHGPDPTLGRSDRPAFCLADVLPRLCMCCGSDVQVSEVVKDQVTEYRKQNLLQ